MFQQRSMDSSWGRSFSPPGHSRVHPSGSAWFDIREPEPEDCVRLPEPEDAGGNIIGSALTATSLSPVVELEDSTCHFSADWRLAIPGQLLQTALLPVGSGCNDSEAGRHTPQANAVTAMSQTQDIQDFSLLASSLIAVDAGGNIIGSALTAASLSPVLELEASTCQLPTDWRLALPGQLLQTALHPVDNGFNDFGANRNLPEANALAAMPHTQDIQEFSLLASSLIAVDSGGWEPGCTWCDKNFVFRKVFLGACVWCPSEGHPAARQGSPLLNGRQHLKGSLLPESCLTTPGSTPSPSRRRLPENAAEDKPQRSDGVVAQRKRAGALRRLGRFASSCCSA